MGSSSSGSTSDSDEGKAVPELSRPELLALNPFELPNFSRQKIRYMAVFDTEKWYPDLAHVTFPTEHAPITWEEGLAVVHFFQEGCCKQKGKITRDDQLHLDSLKRKIGQLCVRLGPKCSEQAFFVRLGPRSPKDAPMMASEPWGISEEEIRRALLKAEVPSQKNPWTLLQLFQTVCCGLLKVSSPEDALARLVSSSRVVEDISRTMQHGRLGWDVNLVVRGWESSVSLDREFRTFVVGGRVAAISQYDDQLLYDFVPTHLESIVGAILCCLDRARPGLERLGLATPSSAVVVDFLLEPGCGDSPWEARLIELNPFGPMTGASLFAWTYDRRLLQHGVDVYGDLDACELEHPPGRWQAPAWIQEEVVFGVPFRFVCQHPPNLSMQRLEVFWPDYVRLLPPHLQ